MYRKILVGYDDSDQSKDALALGKQLADATGADLVVAGVFQWDPVWHAADSRFRDADAEFERHGSPCAVGIAPRGYRGRAENAIAAIAVGFDGSEESGEALTAACRLASETGAKLKLVAVAVAPPIGTGKAGRVAGTRWSRRSRTRPVSGSRRPAVRSPTTSTRRPAWSRAIRSTHSRRSRRHREH
jgi:nucleotide-binding universal stress UspA family protein